MIAAKTMLDAILPQLQDMVATPALQGVQRVLSAAAEQAADAERGGSQSPAVVLPPRPLATSLQGQDPQGSKHLRAPQDRTGRQSPRSTGGMSSESSSSKHGTQETESDFREFLRERCRNPPPANTQALHQHRKRSPAVNNRGVNPPRSIKAQPVSMPTLANFVR
jgi:hypothetical protein